MKKILLFTAALLFIAGWLLVLPAISAQAQDLPAPEDDPVALGKALFFDPDLSVNGTQSCAACHAPEVGFTGPDAPSTRAARFTRARCPTTLATASRPASAYAGDSPELHFDEAERRLVWRHVLGRARHRRTSGRPAGRTGPGSVPEPARAGDRQRPGAVREGQAVRVRRPL